MTKWKSNDFLYVKLRTRLDTIGIAHRSIGFSHDGQEIIIKKDTTEIRIPHDEMLKKLIDVCRVCITGFGIITDQKRIIADEPWK